MTYIIKNNCLALFLIQLLVIVVTSVQAQTSAALFLPQSFQTMSQRWELDSASRRGTFVITPYKPVYVTAGRRSSNPNDKPTSENPRYTLPFRIAYNNYESKFQLSFKTKVAQGLFKGNGDIWVAYTQKAHWQLYNKELSRPFRELNYEPEVILNFSTHYSLFGFTGRMVGIAFNHQSNGRTIPLSRSWNRIIFHAGWERKNWQIFFRPWIRLRDEEDENPAIANYVGRGELIVIHNIGRHQLSVDGTHTFRLGSNKRGSIQGNWVFPIIKRLRGMIQISEGYGETLQDYNHRQTTYGISVSLMEW